MAISSYNMARGGQNPMGKRQVPRKILARRGSLSAAWRCYRHAVSESPPEKHLLVSLFHFLLLCLFHHPIPPFLITPFPPKCLPSLDLSAPLLRASSPRSLSPPSAGHRPLSAFRGERGASRRALLVSRLASQCPRRSRRGYKEDQLDLEMVFLSFAELYKDSQL